MLAKGNVTVILNDDVAVEDSTYTTGRRGIKAVRHLTGSCVTSLEMAGCSVTITAADPAALALWEAPVHTAALRWGM